MCIRDGVVRWTPRIGADGPERVRFGILGAAATFLGIFVLSLIHIDAADEEDSVDLGGRRIFPQKKKTKNQLNHVALHYHSCASVTPTSAPTHVLLSSSTQIYNI